MDRGAIKAITDRWIIEMIKRSSKINEGMNKYIKDSLYH